MLHICEQSVKPFHRTMSTLSFKQSASATKETGSAWWKEAIVYQLYPRSFKDSNGDGIGDLRGIIGQLDYLQQLGITVIWLNPINASPNHDMGYDISNYYAIMDEMGSMQDFDELLEGLHSRGIKLMMDIVVNHTSDAHEWFRQSRSSRSNPYRDYYHWWPAEKGTPPFRWSIFAEDGSAWRYDAVTDSYYLHYFSQQQPDLNWENPTVREEIYKAMRFWLDKGVDGFRLDAITFISKDTSFPVIPEKFNGDYLAFYASGPMLHHYLKEMNREVFSRYDIMTVGEGSGISAEHALSFVSTAGHELQTFYHFDHANWGRRKDDLNYPDASNRKLSELKKIFTRWNQVFEHDGWGTVYFTTHDQSRMVSRFGNDNAYREPSAKLLFTFLLSMRATPYIYQGDELGMTNIRFNNIEDYRDLHTINNYKNLEKNGLDTAAFIDAQKEVARDNSRTPFQWNDSLHAGFSTAEPWLAVNRNHTFVNAASAEKDHSSILHYVKKLITLRKQMPVLVYGDYELLDEANENTYTYTRTMGNEKILVVLNFSDNENEVSLPGTFHTLAELINNYSEPAHTGDRKIWLKPWQAVIYKTG